MQEHRQIFTVLVFCSYFLYFIFLNVLSSGGSRGRTPAPLIVRPNFKTKIFFGDCLPPPSQGLDDAFPPPHPTYLKVWNRHCYSCENGFIVFLLLQINVT